MHILTALRSIGRLGAGKKRLNRRGRLLSENAAATRVCFELLLNLGTTIDPDRAAQQVQEQVQQIRLTLSIRTNSAR